MSAHKHLSQAGDTIVEVLIAILVASSVLALTFATMNRNLIITSDSQEHTEATKLLQGQIEAVHSLRDTNPAALSAATAPFCMVNGLPSGACAGALYTVAITPVSQTYHFVVTWSSRYGGNTNRIEMVYRI